VQQTWKGTVELEFMQVIDWKAPMLAPENALKKALTARDVTDSGSSLFCADDSEAGSAAWDGKNFAFSNVAGDAPDARLDSAAAKAHAVLRTIFPCVSRTHLARRAPRALRGPRARAVHRPSLN
jgi:hypothetical protein